MNESKVIDFNSIKKNKDDKRIKFCMCGAILKTEEEKNIEICYGCIDYALECYVNGEIDKDNPLYDLIKEVKENTKDE